MTGAPGIKSSRSPLARLAQCSAQASFSNCTLNFLIPAYFCKPGRIYASVILWPVEDGPSSSHTARTAQYLQFLNVEAPKVCLVRVNWVDSKGNVTSPTDASMLGTTALASRMLPFPYFETTILGIEVTSSSPFAQLPAQAGGCNTHGRS